jgi:hypothetical protein
LKPFRSIGRQTTTRHFETFWVDWKVKHFCFYVVVLKRCLSGERVAQPFIHIHNLNFLYFLRTVTAGELAKTAKKINCGNDGMQRVLACSDGRPLSGNHHNGTDAGISLLSGMCLRGVIIIVSFYL